VRRGTTRRSSTAATRAPAVDTDLAALRDLACRDAAVGRDLAYLHERRASNVDADTGVFLRYVA
jgi:hypothetical protein